MNQSFVVVILSAQIQSNDPANNHTQVQNLGHVERLSKIEKANRSDQRCPQSAPHGVRHRDIQLGETDVEPNHAMITNMVWSLKAKCKG